MRSTICDRPNAGALWRVLPSALFVLRRLGLALIACAFAAGLAAAAPKDGRDKRTRARTLLVEGSKLLGDGEYAASLEKFQDAYTLVPSPKILYNFGQAYDGMGKPAEALEAFRRFIAEATDAAPANVARARALVTTLERRVAVLVLTGEVQNAAISVDGRTYELGDQREIPINPGPHSVVAERPGLPPFLARITAAPGERVPVVLRFATTPAVQPPRPEPSASGLTTEAPRTETPPTQAGASDTAATSSVGGTGAAEPQTHPRAWQKPAAWVATGLASAALAAGVVTGLSANSRFGKFNRAANGCGEDVPNQGAPGCQQIYDDAASARRLSIGSFIGAGLLGATAAALFFTLPEASDERRIACAPLLATPGAGCALRF